MKPNRPILFAAAALLTAALSGCGAGRETPSVGEYSYVYESETLSAPVYSTSPTVPSGTLPSSAPATTLPTQPVTTLPSVPETAPSLPVPTTEVPTTEIPVTLPPEVPTTDVLPTDAQGRIDLHVELPDANGTMVVSTERTNPYIALVSAQRNLPVERLVAVYTVPQTGQNYVFEFNAGARTVENLRRVYLIDRNDQIDSVAATDWNEAENVSQTENWFCMNVLIKNMIFPKIAGELS